MSAVRRPIQALCVDADDTLWQNEHFYSLTTERFVSIISRYCDASHVNDKLLSVERKNLKLYGFGIKGFILSLLETALEITDERIGPDAIREIIEIGKELLQHPIELLPDVRETLECLREKMPIVLVTKGDLFDQERKLAQSGLAELFTTVEIVTEKDAGTFARVFDGVGVASEEGAMVGNSLRSDILPALEVGAWGFFVPHDLTWSVENAELPVAHPRFRHLAAFSDLPDAIEAVS